MGLIETIQRFFGFGKVNKMRLFVRIIIPAVVLTSCAVFDVPNAHTETDLQENVSSMFVAVEKTAEWTIVYHKETKVMYAVSRPSYNAGNFTLLVNADGSPMLWLGGE